MQAKDKAVCIRAIDYSDTSQIATFFTEHHGKVDIIAKGSRRQKSKFGGPLEMFSFGQIVFSYTEVSNLATLIEFDQLPLASQLAFNLDAMNISLFAAELVYALTEKFDPHKELFESLVEFLKNAEQTKDKKELMILLIVFQLSILKETGLQPSIRSCSNCAHEFSDMNYVYFSGSASGLVCRDCENSFPDKIRLSPQAARALTNLNRLSETSIDNLHEIEKMLINYLRDLMHKWPKMAKYIAQIR